VLKIGEFSALTQVSIKTLRYYDEIGLLKPLSIDPATGYRYYSASQLPRLHRILALKDLGFPLNRVAEALDEGVTADALRGMLMLRRGEQEDRVQEELERLARLKARIRMIEQGGLMSADVILKEVPPQWMVSLRETIPSYRAIGALFGRLYGELGALAGEGPGVALFHDAEFKDEGVDAEVGVYLRQAAAVTAPLTVRELPRVSVASIIHHGAFNRVAEATIAVLHWIEDNGYRQAGPLRELFLRISEPVSRDDESNVTEIQVPVEKA
jgi:DNA-binding transcriptional MerR regulator